MVLFLAYSFCFRRNFKGNFRKKQDKKLFFCPSPQENSLTVLMFGNDLEMSLAWQKHSGGYLRTFWSQEGLLQSSAEEQSNE